VDFVQQLVVVESDYSYEDIVVEGIPLELLDSCIELLEVNELIYFCAQKHRVIFIFFDFLDFLIHF
jgi:hypothetical protein